MLTMHQKQKNNIARMATSPFRLKLFMLRHLPIGWVTGLKVVSFDEKEVRVSVPYKYWNKNPFRSIYFAVLAMAAELSTAMAGLAASEDAGVPVSMLVLGMRAEFTKKAKTKIVFRCADGERMRQAVAKSIETGEGQIVEVAAAGTDAAGDEVAKFWITWTFKPRNLKGKKQ